MVIWPNSDSLTQDILSQNKPKLCFGTCIFLQLSGSECVFSVEKRKVEQEHLELVTESLWTFFSLSSSLFHGMSLLHKYVIFFLWIMISSLLWLTSARQVSNTQVVGEMGSTPAHTSSWWGFSERERGKDCCYNENELNEHFASFFPLFSSFLLFSYLFFSSFFFPLFSSPFQSQRFITTPGWTHKLLPWFSTYQELIFKKRSEKKERKCKKEDLGQTFSHNVPHCTYLGCAWSTDRKSNN